MVRGQAEGDRRSLIMLFCCIVFGSGGGVGDDGFAVADGDVLTGECLELGGEVAGAAVFVDPGFEYPGPRSQNSASGSESRW